MHSQLWDLVELVFVWIFYVETNGPTLEQISRIFDGEDAVAHIDLHQVEKEIHQAEHENEFDDEKHAVMPNKAV